MTESSESGFFALAADEQSAKLTQLAEELLPLWGQRARIVRLIKFRENAVFEVQLDDGERAALRIHRQGYHSRLALVSEFQWTGLLADQGLRVPRGIETEDGRDIVVAESRHVPGQWLVDMLAWVDGEMLGEVGVPLNIDAQRLPTVFHNLGADMARLHRISRTWDAHDTQPRHRWNLEGFIGENPVWGRFWELAALTSEQQAFFSDIRSVFSEHLLAIGETAENYGLIHADLVPENVLLTGNDVNLIDFDDAGYGWYLFEIATALFWLADEPDFADIKSALIAGYQSVTPISDADLEQLDLFLALRSTTYLGWVHTRQNTAIAEELTPLVIEIAERVCRGYLQGRAA